MPELEVVLAVEHTREPVLALHAGRVDVALLTFGETPRPQCDEEPLFSDALVFVMSRSHPLAKRKSVSPDDLRAYPLLTSRAPTGEMQWFLRNAFGRAHAGLKFEFLPLTEALLEVARNGQGVAILSEWLLPAHLEAGQLVAKHLTRGPLRRPWRLAWQRDVAPLAKVLGEVLRAEVPGGGKGHGDADSNTKMRDQPGARRAPLQAKRR